MIFDLAGVLAQAVDARGDGRADGRAVLNPGGLDAVEILLQPVVIERERADQVGRAGERDDADAVVGPVFDELRDDGLHDVNAVGRLAVELEVERLHRAGHVQREHDVDAAGLHFGAAVAELRPRQADHHQRAGQDRQPPDPAARATARVAGDAAGRD